MVTQVKTRRDMIGKNKEDVKKMESHICDTHLPVPAEREPIHTKRRTTNEGQRGINDEEKWRLLNRKGSP